MSVLAQIILSYGRLNSLRIEPANRLRSAVHRFPWFGSTSSKRRNVTREVMQTLASIQTCLAYVAYVWLFVASGIGEASTCDATLLLQACQSSIPCTIRKCIEMTFQPLSAAMEYFRVSASLSFSRRVPERML
eukprot:474120-Amphidinium_carterae.1